MLEQPPDSPWPDYVIGHCPGAGYLVIGTQDNQLWGFFLDREEAVRTIQELEDDDE